MTQQPILASRLVRSALEEISRFHRAQQLTSGDALAVRVREIESTVHRSSYASAVWHLGTDCRYLIRHYADYVECLDRYREELGVEFDKLKQLSDKITEICEQIGIDEIRRSLEYELNTKADGGAFRRDDAVFLNASITNPAIHTWGCALVRSEIVSTVIPALEWPPGIIPRELHLLDPECSRGSWQVIISVLVGEKIQG